MLKMIVPLCLHQLWTIALVLTLQMFLQNSRFLCLSVRGSWQQLNSEPMIHGEVHSPQYPGPYLPNQKKEWDLWVPEGYQIQLSLTHLDIKASSGCHQDSVTVRV